MTVSDRETWLQSFTQDCTCTGMSVSYLALSRSVGSSSLNQRTSGLGALIPIPVIFSLPGLLLKDWQLVCIKNLSGRGSKHMTLEAAASASTCLHTKAHRALWSFILLIKKTAKTRVEQNLKSKHRTKRSTSVLLWAQSAAALPVWRQKLDSQFLGGWREDRDWTEI